MWLTFSAGVPPLCLTFLLVYHIDQYQVSKLNSVCEVPELVISSHTTALLMTHPHTCIQTLT